MRSIIFIAMLFCAATGGLVLGEALLATFRSALKLKRRESE
jgi:hypothetical protein